MQNILVIDDEAPIRELLRAFLSRRQYAVTTAGCLQEAEQCLEENSFASGDPGYFAAGRTGLGFFGSTPAPLSIRTGRDHDRNHFYRSGSY